MLPSRALPTLICPDCRAALAVDAEAAMCSGCGQTFKFEASGQIDLRPTRVRTTTLDVDIGPVPPVDDEVFGPIPMMPGYRGAPLSAEQQYGNRVTDALLSHVPHAADDRGGMMLDLGSGSGIIRDRAPSTGLDYVGADVSGDDPDVLVDADTLPFADDTFDLVLFVAVLEHLRNPWVAVREIHRVLRPGGRLLGTVAFLEPFHMDSYYHHTHLGTYRTLAGAGLRVQHIETNTTWSGLRALTEMRFFPGLPDLVVDGLFAPLNLAHRLWWWLLGRLKPRGRTAAMDRQMILTGGFRFVADKP